MEFAFLFVINNDDYIINGGFTCVVVIHFIGKEKLAGWLMDF